MQSPDVIVQEPLTALYSTMSTNPLSTTMTIFHLLPAAGPAIPTGWRAAGWWIISGGAGNRTRVQSRPDGSWGPLQAPSAPRRLAIGSVKACHPPVFLFQRDVIAVEPHNRF